MKKQQDNNTQNKKFRILLGILTLWLMCGQTLWAQTTNKYYSIDIYADSYAGGDGSKTNPYEIATAEQLAKLARDVNNGNTPQAFLGKYFKLTADIDLKNGIWMPIGKYYNYGDGNGANRLFFGKFDGNGHVIKNMHIQWEGTEARSAWGLFSTLQGASSTNLTTVTNLIIKDATVEKKPGFDPHGPGYKVGVVAGEIYGNTELSNIIIHGSEIKDNDETYEINNESKIGGIAGNVQTDSKNETFRIFNIAADTQINMLKNTSVHNDKFHIAQGFGRFSYDMKGGDNIIEPTNIYLFDNGLNIENTSTNINKGGITANCQNEGNANKYVSTWYYTQYVDGGKNLGTQKTDASFKNEFVNKANEFIHKSANNFQDKLNWSYTSGTGFNFGSTKLTVKRGYNTIITAETVKGNAGNEKYFWYTSTDKKNWTLQNENNPYNNFSISLTDFDQYVYAKLEDGSSQSGVAKIEARKVDAVMKHKENTIYIDINNNIWDNNDNLDIKYSWVKNDDVEVGTEPTFDKSSLGSTDKLSCHVIVTTKDGVELLNKWLVYTKSVVYLCPAGATGTTAEGNKISYNQGDDSNDGQTPETAVRTWKGAYSKLEKNGSWDDNTIVLMGMSDKDVTNNGNDGFTSVTFNTSSDWEREKAESPFFRNTTITGSWDGVNYKGIIEMYGGHDRNHSLPIYGDTRFQYLTFNRNNNNENYDILYCQFYNLEMGEGIQMTNYKNMFSGDGTIKGAVSTSFQIFGGFMDDNRFSPLSTEGNLKKMDDALPHGREGFKIKIKSGHYSSICVGGRQTVENRNGVMGSPNMPIKCTIDVDIDRKFNDNHNENNSTLDVAIVLAGNHEGAMVGDVDIIIKSGKIGRVVNQ